MTKVDFSKKIARLASRGLGHVALAIFICDIWLNNMKCIEFQDEHDGTTFTERFCKQKCNPVFKVDEKKIVHIWTV
jgi:hypothetical protein